MKIKIKYFSKNYPRLKKLGVGDWIDLRVDRLSAYCGTTIYMEGGYYNKIEYKKGDIIKFGLGVAMELPKAMKQK